MGQITVNNYLGGTTLLGCKVDAGVSFVTSAEQRVSLMGEDFVVIQVNSSFPLPIGVLDSIVIFGELYTLFLPPEFKKNASNDYDYTLTFEGITGYLKNTILLMRFGRDYFQSDFPFYGEVDKFIDLFTDNILRNTAKITFVNSSTPTDKKLNISFSGVNLFEALNTLMDEFGLEYTITATSELYCNITIKDKVGTDLTSTDKFQVGQNKGLLSLSRKNVADSDFCTRLYGYGSDRNLPYEYAGFFPRLLPESIDDSQAYNDTDAQQLYDYVEKVKIWDEIMPSRTGTITALPDISESFKAYISCNVYMMNTVQAAYPYNLSFYQVGDLIVSDGTVIPIGTTITEITPSGLVLSANVLADSTYTPVTIERTKSGRDVNVFLDGDIDFDVLEKDAEGDYIYIISDVEAKIAIITGKLAGYEFVLENFWYAEKKFRLKTITDERGLVLPNPTETEFQLNIGDTYKLIDISLPSSYTLAAEAELSVEVTAFLQKNNAPKVQYVAEVFDVYLKANTHSRAINDLFRVGDIITLQDDALGIDTNARITGFTRNISNPYKYTFTLAEANFRPPIYKRNQIINSLINKTGGNSALKSGSRKLSRAKFLNPNGVDGGKADSEYFKK